MDEKRPLVKVVTRPATAEERQQYGLGASEIKDIKTHDFLSCAEIYAEVSGKIELVSSAFGHANYKNIHLKGKDFDTFRLCKDMSETRAISRALSQVYDFFGLESYEEVALAPEVDRRSGPIDVEAEVVEPAGVDLILKLMEENKEILEPEFFEKYTAGRLKEYTEDGLKDTYASLQAHIKAKRKESDPGLDPPEAGAEEKGVPEEAQGQETDQKRLPV